MAHDAAQIRYGRPRMQTNDIDTYLMQQPERDSKIADSLKIVPIPEPKHVWCWTKVLTVVFSHCRDEKMQVNCRLQIYASQSFYKYSLVLEIHFHPLRSYSSNQYSSAKARHLLKDKAFKAFLQSTQRLKRLLLASYFGYLSSVTWLGSISRAQPSFLLFSEKQEDCLNNNTISG